MNTNAPANLQQLSALLRQGEGPALEVKRSTGELKEGMKTLCAFLNGTGGMAPEMPVLRNPIIADVFHRAGLIEKWGRGTNRVIEMCRKAGIRPPEFHEIAGSAVVKFHVPVGVTVQVTDQVTNQVERLLALLGNRPITAAEIMRGLEMNHRPTLRDNYLHPALQAGLIEMTVPDKPNSRL